MFLLLAGALAQNEDLVTDITVEGYDRPWYSGYLNLTQGKLFHYMFFPSQSGLKDDPVLLWLNGGPGCSSLLGLFHENGPFVFDRNSSHLRLNNYSWNKNAQVLYLQSPGGVGFSKGPLQNSDQSTAEDNYNALLAFYAKFPAYAGNSLFISGQSYAGVYLPTLALKLDAAGMANFKGFIVGNPCTTSEDCYDRDITGTDLGRHQVSFLQRHGFISQEVFSEYRNKCTLGFDSPTCSNVVARIARDFYALNVSINGIYQPCYFQLYEDRNSRRTRGDEVNCDDEVGSHTFLNSVKTKQALHVDASIKWASCSDVIYNRYTKNESQGYFAYPKLIGKYRIWVFSGDTDANVPITGTKYWIGKLREQLDLPQVRPWREWWVKGRYPHQDQIGGDVWELQGLTFVSVKGAGHLVPAYRPRASFEMISAFLEGRELPFN